MRRVIWTPAVGESLPDQYALPLVYDLDILGVVCDGLVDDDWSTKGTIHFEARLREDGSYTVVTSLPPGIEMQHEWAGSKEHVERSNLDVSDPYL